ncbi:MAG: glycoside hydrolase family 28 protein, partial [Cetobacterium sp.]
PEKPIQNVKFKNVSIKFTKDEVEEDYPAMMSFIEKEAKAGFFIKNSENVSFENVEIIGNVGDKIRD